MNLGATPQLECWNNGNSGILGYGKMVKWVIGKIHINREVQDVNK